MKLYALSFNVDHECSVLLGVFSSREKALAAQAEHARLMHGYHGVSHTIQVVDLDKDTIQVVK